MGDIVKVYRKIKVQNDFDLIEITQQPEIFSEVAGRFCVLAAYHNTSCSVKTVT
jgi:hypothetical protein